MTELIDSLEKIADILYKDKINEGIAMMSSVIPDLGIYVQTIETEESRQIFLNNALMPALEAMEKKDAIMLADIISYEIIEMIKG